MPQRPNIVLILTDNQSDWTLGCYGNPDIRTPHIDGLAAAGTRFANAYCVNSVCSPSRATWLTGLIPSAHGVHCYLGPERPSAELGPAAYSTIAEFPSLPARLAGAGYDCGMVGKWHLGASLTPQAGFTTWFAKAGGHTRSYLETEAVRDGQLYTEHGYFTDVLTAHAVDFLRRARTQPFFLYLAYNAPYGLGDWVLNPHTNRHSAYYAQRPLACFPRPPAHPWLRQNRGFVGNPTAMRAYAAEVSAVDDGVGQVLAELEARGLTDDTLVIFTADQGLCAGHHGMWGMGDHARPIHTYEPAIRVPLTFRQPGRVPAGRVFTPRVANYDFFTSVLDYLEMDACVAHSPGASYAAVLRGAAHAPDETIFHEFEHARMIRTGPWKYTWRYGAAPDELYDMEHDPGEWVNLAPRPEHAARVGELRARLATFFERYADPRYDLWRGGRAKSAVLTMAPPPA